jgi:lysophospholipase L1-like esterase
VPGLITITAGANDVHWSSFARACYATDCATDLNRGLARFYLTGLQAKLDYVFRTIQSRSNGRPPTVIITGYYNPISNYCKNRQNFITNAEIDFLNSQRNNLNQTIRSAAANYPFVRYASVDFSGQGLCSSNPLAQGIEDAAPLHPTAEGQQRIAESVIGALNGGTSAR